VDSSAKGHAYAGVLDVGKTLRWGGSRPEDFPSSVCATPQFQSAFPFVPREIPPNPKLQALTHVRGIVRSTEPYLYRYCEAAFAATLVDRRHGVIVSSSAFDQTVLIGRARNVGSYSLVRSHQICSAVHVVADDGGFGSGWGSAPVRVTQCCLDSLRKPAIDRTNVTSRILRAFAVRTACTRQSCRLELILTRFSIKGGVSISY